MLPGIIETIDGAAGLGGFYTAVEIPGRLDILTVDVGKLGFIEDTGRGFIAAGQARASDCANPVQQQECEMNRDQARLFIAGTTWNGGVHAGE